jgi:hypothetical protein
MEDLYEYESVHCTILSHKWLESHTARSSHPIGHTETLVPAEWIAKPVTEPPRYDPSFRVCSICFGPWIRKRLADGSSMFSLPACMNGPAALEGSSNNAKFTTDVWD